MQQGKCGRTRESGVSEVIGSIMLISIVVAAIAIIGATLLMQQAPVKIPSLDATISSVGHTVQIYHNGGDTLQAEEFSILVDGAVVPFQKAGDPSWKTWSNGETLTYVSPQTTTPQTVYVLFNRGGSSTILSSVVFGEAGMSTASRRITATAGPGGTIDPSGVIEIVYGESRIFTITADEGYQVLDVAVDGSSVGPVSSYTFPTVTSSHIIYASFVKQPVITATAGPNGAISPSGSIYVVPGGSQEFTITPATGYHITDVSVDGVSQGAISSYTFTNVLEDHVIAASFAINTYTITSSTGANGTITPSGTITVNHGGNQAFTITASPHHHIADVLVDGVSAGAISTYTFSNVTTNHTISASFAIDTYTIVTSVGNGGYISPSGDVVVPYGNPQTFLITANSGYTIYDVMVDGSSLGALSSYTFPAVSANHTINATFAGVPQFVSITPTVGSTAGGTVVFITGNNFAGASSVTFGGMAASSFTVNNDTSITATTPAHAAGTVSVAIVTPGGTATGTNAFTFAAAPTFASIAPSSGPLSGGNSAIITGTGFTGTTSVTFGGTPATSFTVNSATSITAVVPSHAAGTVSVLITTPTGTATGTNAYTYAAAPVYSAISPVTGLNSSATTVTITGSGFTGVTGVTIKGVPATYTLVNDNTISAVTPASTDVGASDVVITTPAGTATGTNAFTYFYRYTRTATGTTTISVPVGASTAEYLVVAGGGGGGRAGGGGGGAGGFLTGTLSVSPGNPLTVTVGTGGAGATSANVRGSNGENSVFGTITANGGGGGGSSGSATYYSGADGGSGGGGSRSLTTGTGGAGTSGQGSNGGAGNTQSTAYKGGGGGGAGATGVSAVTSAAGAGGSGTTSSLSGTAVTYSCGGGGGAVSGTVGAYGCSSAGAGVSGSATADAADANRGGGGGGSGATNRAGGNGGSGIVIAIFS